MPSFISEKINRLPNEFKGTLMARSFGLFKIPLIFMVAPKVLELNEEVCKVKIPLNRITRNHVGSLYFGTLAIAADLAAGLHAMHLAHERGNKLQLLFKSFSAEFHKRCEGDTVVVCTEGPLILEKFTEAQNTGERVNFPVRMQAFVPDKLGEEVAADFSLEMSIKIEV